MFDLRCQNGCRFLCEICFIHSLFRHNGRSIRIKNQTACEKQIRYKYGPSGSTSVYMRATCRRTYILHMHLTDSDVLLVVTFNYRLYIKPTAARCLFALRLSKYKRRYVQRHERFLCTYTSQSQTNV